MVRIQTVSPEQASQLKAVRLSALYESPSAFGSTYAAEVTLPETEWIRRATPDASGRSISYLAYESDENAAAASEEACGIVRGWLDNRVEGVAFVQAMWVAPHVRRRGVGRELIEVVADWARSRGMHTLKLMVTSSNEPAIGFYRRLGFAMTGRVQPYPNDPRLCEYEMGRSLASR
jgi:ribosomal protein S18 acetylase RimI-like enzyme